MMDRYTPLQLVALVNQLHVRLVVVHVVQVVATRIHGVRGIGFQPGVSAFLKQLDHRLHVIRSGVKGTVRSTSEVDQFFGPKGVAELDDNLHELLHCLALLAVQDVLFLLGQRHFVGRLGIRLPVGTSAIFEALLWLPINTRGAAVGMLESICVTRRIAGLPRARGTISPKYGRLRTQRKQKPESLREPTSKFSISSFDIVL